MIMTGYGGGQLIGNPYQRLHKPDMNPGVRIRLALTR